MYPWNSGPDAVPGTVLPNQPGPCSHPTGQVARNRHLKVVPSTPRIYYHSVQSGRPSLGRAREPERTLQRGTTTTSPAPGPGHTRSALHLTTHSFGRATGRLGGHSPSALANASTKCFTPGRPREHPGGGHLRPDPAGRLRPGARRQREDPGHHRVPAPTDHRKPRLISPTTGTAGGASPTGPAPSGTARPLTVPKLHLIHRTAAGTGCRPHKAAGPTDHSTVQSPHHSGRQP